MPQTCPACGAAGAKLGPPSRRSGRVVAACRRCHCHWLANPPETEEILDNQEYDREVYESYIGAKRISSLEADYHATLSSVRSLIRSGGNVLFDVGAGSGEFLAIARDQGFVPAGNELAGAAVAMAAERTGIKLHLGDLSTIEEPEQYDAVTMWCVLAHATDPDELLRDVLRVLKPGGVLFLQTPRWSAMDTAALGAARMSGGRLTRVLDRRVNEYHMTLNSAAGLTSQVERQGFEVVEVRPRARYSLRTAFYLTSMGMSQRASQAAARVFDTAIDRDLFFRNVLDLYARKPLV